MGGRLSVLFSGVLAVTAIAVPASAAPGATRLNQQVTGPYTGSHSFEVGDGCAVVHEEVTATYEAAGGGKGSFSMDVCVEFPPGVSAAYQGTFELTTAKGASVRGTVAGALDVEGVLHEVLSVTAATREFRRSTGTIQLSGTFSNTSPGPFTGQLTGTLTRG